MDKPQDKSVMDGGPAFPRLYPRSDEDGTSGMSLRDCIAIVALQGLLACPDTEGSEEMFANDAYRYADAMLEARKKVPTSC